ncbi:MAG: hypothetical protein Q7U47_12305 [Paludibacter sp.]|nr:hypothetical protein [Paludibacter sp.]
MNTSFNINRLGLLIKRFFVENKQKELTFWGITIVVFMLMHEISSVTMYLFITGFIFAARMYKIFGYTPGGMHYLLIPATHTEKLASSVLLSIFYYFIMFLITYTIGTFLGITFSNLIFGTDRMLYFDLFGAGNLEGLQVSRTNPENLWNIFIGFSIIQSVFLLGSLYFKRNAVGRTMISVFALFFVLGIIEYFFLKNMTGGFPHSTTVNLSLMKFEGDFTAFETILNILKYLITPFLLVVCYFRLTEKQV